MPTGILLQVPTGILVDVTESSMPAMDVAMAQIARDPLVAEEDLQFGMYVLIGLFLSVSV